MSSTFLSDYFIMKTLSDMGENIENLSSMSSTLLTRTSVSSVVEKDPESNAAFREIQEHLSGLAGGMDKLVARAIEMDDTEYFTKDGRFFTHEAWLVVSTLLTSKLAVQVSEYFELCEKRFKNTSDVKRATQHLIRQRLLSRHRTPYYTTRSDGSMTEKLVTAYSLTDVGRTMAGDSTFTYTPHFGESAEIRDKPAEVLQFDPSKRKK